MLKLSKKVFIKIVEPLQSIRQLEPMVQNLLETSNEQIIFLDKVELEIDMFCESGPQYLHELISIPKKDYRNFFNVLYDVINILRKIPRKKYYGKVKSQKGKLEFEFLFEYYISYNSVYKSKTYNFLIWEEGRENQSKFMFDLRVMENGKDLKVVNLYPDSERHYIGKGLSIAMIRKSKIIFRKRIISSSNLNKTYLQERRFPDATNKVWQRLVDGNFAAYNEAEDYYYTI